MFQGHLEETVFLYFFRETSIIPIIRVVNKKLTNEDFSKLLLGYPNNFEVTVFQLDLQKTGYFISVFRTTNSFLNLGYHTWDSLGENNNG